MFTPIETSIGALLLYQATSVLLFQNGTVLGVSGHMRRLFSRPTRENFALFAGMAASILPLKWFLPELVTVYPPMPDTLLAALATIGIGMFEGWGTKLSDGCTSGHMLCGLSRLSATSAVAVATFFPVAMITHHLLHPSLRTEVCVSGLPCYTPTYPSRNTTIGLVLFAAATIAACQVIPRIVGGIPAKVNQKKSDSTARQITQFCAGLEFGIGLHLTQMSSPSKVLAFLSFPSMSVWDPSMGLVILFAILPSILEIQIRGLRNPPLFNERYVLSKKTIGNVDWKFVLGAAAFGIGWGLSGICPGPAVLRSFTQPFWGLLWMGGFYLGGQMAADGEASAAEGTCG